MVDSVKRTIMRRDDISCEEAEERVEEFRLGMSSILNRGGSLEDLEDLMSNEFGLEPDYIEEFLL